MKRYLVEFIGTFFLVLTVGLSQSPLAIGAILAAMVYMGGYISGAHYNPAVTLAVWIRGKIKGSVAGWYMLSQLLGAVIAAKTYWLLRGAFFTVSPGLNVSFAAAALAEAIFTFALASVVLHSAVTKKTEGNDYYGLAIGLVVMAGAFSVGSISGGAFNPAVGVGPILVDIANWGQNGTNILLYLLGPAIGATLAALAHSYLTD
ncbi:MAG TPA: aquaporin [Candidatus Nanoarchaeia archaeon]|nr:aquaporin [Candidatus Nanoarchaeia archaeon]